MRKLNYTNLDDNIENWIKSYLNSAGLKGAVIGLSGGIDSAVTTALFAKALGKENVLSVGLPCESLYQDLEDAKFVAESLGIQFLTFDLTSIFKELLKSLSSKTKENKIALANIKPRLRMLTLYSIAQSMGYIVGGTGNRTEIAIGYFTKYGDLGIIYEFLH